MPTRDPLADLHSDLAVYRWPDPAGVFTQPICLLGRNLVVVSQVELEEAGQLDFNILKTNRWPRHEHPQSSPTNSESHGQYRDP